jgi:hypothetical protein
VLSSRAGSRNGQDVTKVSEPAEHHRTIDCRDRACEFLKCRKAARMWQQCYRPELTGHRVFSTILAFSSSSLLLRLPRPAAASPLAGFRRQRSTASFGVRSAPTGVLIFSQSALRPAR